MKFARNLNLDGNTRPTWQLVVLMILILAVETVGDLSGCVGPRPDYEACEGLCGRGNVASVGVNYCNCHPKGEK